MVVDKDINKKQRLLLMMINFEFIFKYLKPLSGFHYSRTCLFPIEESPGKIVDLIIDECLFLQFATAKKQMGNLIISKFHQDWIRIILRHSNRSNLQIYFNQIDQFSEGNNFGRIFVKHISDYLRSLSFSDQVIYLEQDMVNISNDELVDIIIMFSGCFHNLNKACKNEPINESLTCNQKHKLSESIYISSKKLQRCYDIMIEVYQKTDNIL